MCDLSRIHRSVCAISDCKTPCSENNKRGMERIDACVLLGDLAAAIRGGRAGLDLDTCDSPAGNRAAPEIALHWSECQWGGNNQGRTALWASSHEACVRHAPCRGCLAGSPN